MKALIWIDWVIITLIAVSALFSLKRGFVREALSLVTWVAAFIVARTFHPHMQTLLTSVIETPLFRSARGFRHSLYWYAAGRRGHQQPGCTPGGDHRAVLH